nr:Methyltransferase-like protein 5 [Ipomoea batatas]
MKICNRSEATRGPFLGSLDSSRQSEGRYGFVSMRYQETYVEGQIVEYVVMNPPFWNTEEQGADWTSFLWLEGLLLKRFYSLQQDTTREPAQSKELLARFNAMQLAEVICELRLRRATAVQIFHKKGGRHLLWIYGDFVSSNDMPRETVQKNMSPSALSALVNLGEKSNGILLALHGLVDLS